MARKRYKPVVSHGHPFPLPSPDFPRARELQPERRARAMSSVL